MTGQLFRTEPNARTNDQCTDSTSRPAKCVDYLQNKEGYKEEEQTSNRYPGASKVDERNGEAGHKPTLGRPGPVHDRWVNEAGHDDGEQGVALGRGPFD